MVYRIKSKKEKIKFDKNTEFYLVNVEEKTYDPYLIKGWDDAVKLNLVYQMSSGEERVVPMPKAWVMKNKLKERRFLAR